MWSDEVATPGGLAYGSTLRPPTLAPFYFGVQGQGSQQGRVGSVLAQGRLPGWMHRTKEVSAKGCSGVVLSKGGQGQWASARTLDTGVGALLGGGGACSGEPGVSHKPHGAPWPPGRRWTSSQRPGSRWPHLAMGFLGTRARAQVVLYILEYVLTYAPHPNSHGRHGSHLSLSAAFGKQSRARARLRCPEVVAAGSALSPRVSSLALPVQATCFGSAVPWPAASPKL